MLVEDTLLIVTVADIRPKEMKYLQVFKYPTCLYFL